MKKITYFFAVLVGIFILFGNVQVEAATTVNVKLGSKVSVKANGAKYKIADSSIAFVDEEGSVYGKKVGTTNLTIIKNGKKTNSTLVVKKNDKKPKMNVCVGEVDVSSPAIEVEECKDGYKYKVSIIVKNIGEKTIPKVEIYSKIGDKSVNFAVGNIKSGKSKTIEKSENIEKEQVEVELKKLCVYSNKMVQEYTYKNNKLKYDYATEDTVAPVITGFVGKNSYNDKVTYRVIYSDDKNFDYYKYVKATDDRNTKVKLTVDTSKVNFKKNGTYEITYIAEDKAGNETRKSAKIGVRVVDDLDRMCSSVLKSITKDSWSDTKKATAIYNYIKGHMHYTGYSDKSSWEKEAARGLRYGGGDCFTYYAMSRALLTRAGIPNIEVRRVKGSGEHWWSLVYVQNGFYHFDVTPRRAGGRFCLVTDDQLKAYSRKHGNSHIWAYDKKPKSATKKISSIF